jgi:hypothetical protein
MDKDKVKEHIQKHMEQDDVLIGFFYAQQALKIWLFVLIGPFAAFSMKFYFVGVTSKGIHFHRLNLFGKFAGHDFFEYDEIENVKIGKGLLQRPMKFQFKNGRSLKLKAQLKGVEKVAKLNEVTQVYIENNITMLE